MSITQKHTFGKLNFLVGGGGGGGVTDDLYQISVHSGPLISIIITIRIKHFTLQYTGEKVFISLLKCLMRNKPCYNKPRMSRLPINMATFSVESCLLLK